MVDRKEEILKIATKLFSEGGYDNTSTRELANAAGISVAGIYYFFQNKEEILFNILSMSLAELFESIQTAIIKDKDPLINLTQIIDNFVRQIVDHKMEMGLLLSESKRLNPEQLIIINNKKSDEYKLIKNEITILDNQGLLGNFNLTYTTFALFAIINYIHQWFDPNGPLSPQEFAKQTTNLFLNGILK